VPGSTLLFLASQQGFRCTGVDFSPRIHDVASAFSDQGIQAQFVQTDFLEWDTEARFDLVYSCGFVEHFSDYQAVIEKHWRLVCPEGLMLLTVPVLTPAQRLIRLVAYERLKMQEVLDTHNLEIMNLDKLRRAVMACGGSTVIVSTYAREMTVWFGPNDPGVRRWTKPLFRPLRFVERLVHQVGASSRWFSPEVLVLARKRS
jgi:cyclopropane fatty-acyl-phospholipid synthase-like methyltransferase